MARRARKLILMSASGLARSSQIYHYIILFCFNFRRLLNLSKCSLLVCLLCMPSARISNTTVHIAELEASSSGEMLPCEEVSATVEAQQFNATLRHLQADLGCTLLLYDGGVDSKVTFKVSEYCALE